ncbi:hypothetical protein NG796_07705 [Laspinema sp. A4]|uniref:hypothetical protein n=1 Tax=Laspinema sp. D2d TaxID=2953686 RepID=UPI0021BB1338|nr:hypothetical protein [Laspinema sp. D2d]MCT7983176.1 hypothetical protein [Laspinema sp. D2d]
MMKRWFLWIFTSLFTVGLILWVTPARTQNKVDGNCTYNDISLFGKVQIVESFPDLKIQMVASFPDLRVKMVNSFPDACGKWQVVESFPDFKVKVVDSFPDLKIKWVDSSPGIP